VNSSTFATLATQNDPLNAAAITAALGALGARYRIEVVDSCASTNALLRERAEQGTAARGVICSVVVCEEQTAGRGRRGRHWRSAGEGSLTFSLLWRFAPGTPLPSALSLVTGLAVARALEQLDARDIALKWPNDILLRGRKLGGILIEVTQNQREGTAVVIGIGLNLSLPPDFEIGSDTSGDFGVAALNETLPKLPARNALLARLLIEIDIVFAQFAAHGFDDLREQWLSRHALQDAELRVVLDQHTLLEGRCSGIDADGALLLTTVSGTQRVVSGEVSVRRRG